MLPIVPLMLLSGCAGDLSALDPAGPAARSIARLWWVMLTGSAVLFALVLGLFLLALLRPAAAGALLPRRWIVLGGLVLPTPVLILLLVAALAQGEHLLSAGAGDTLRVEARARQWVWEFAYPDLPDAAPTQGVLHIPAGRVVEVTALSQDVIHSFWVPRLGGKIDATPGHAAVLRILADRPGTFGGVCAEYCGTGHAGMAFRVVAHAPEDFRAALAGAAP